MVLQVVQHPPDCVRKGNAIHFDIQLLPSYVLPFPIGELSVTCNLCKWNFTAPEPYSLHCTQVTIQPIIKNLSQKTSLRFNMNTTSASESQSPFCFQIKLYNNSEEIQNIYTNPFIVVSHPSVWESMKIVVEDVCSCDWIGHDVHGGCRIILIGGKFRESTTLALKITTEHENMLLLRDQIKFRSQEILEFRLPRYPGLDKVRGISLLEKLSAFIQVTNNGVIWSEPKQFYYVNFSIGASPLQSPIALSPLPSPINISPLPSPLASPSSSPKTPRLPNTNYIF